MFNQNFSDFRFVKLSGVVQRRPPVFALPDSYVRLQAAETKTADSFKSDGRKNNLSKQFI